MLEQAHERGIKVIMDFVINHTSQDHPWFQEALSNVNSPYRDYYRFVSKYDTDNYDESDCSPWGSEVWFSSGDYYYYSAFYGMPDLNYNNPQVRTEIKQAASKWLDMGIDGFRLDAAMHIYGDWEFRLMTDAERLDANIQWWNEFAGFCESINPDVYLVGEAWQNDEILPEYAQPFDTKFNFAFEQNLIESVINETAVCSETSLADYLRNILDEYAKTDTNYLDGVFGANHDQNRIMSQMDGDEDKAKLVASVYMTLPGNPFIYYGEELGMYGSGADEDKRTPFLWENDGGMNTSWESDSQNETTKSLKEQQDDEKSIFNFYREIIKLRKSHTALSEGSYTAVSAGNDSVMAYIRESDDEKLLVLHNFSEDYVCITADNMPSELSGEEEMTVEYSSGQNTSIEKGSVQMAAKSTLILKM